MNWRTLKLVGLLVGVLAVTSCSSTSDAADYNADSRAGFLAACNDSVGDSRLVSDVCACVYAEVEDSVDYSELQSEMEQTTSGDETPLVVLSASVEEIVAGCIVGNARLES